MSLVKTSGVKNGGLFRTIFIASMLCMLIPVVLVSILSIRPFYKSLEEKVQTNLQQLSIEKSNEVDAMIQNQVALTKSVAQSSYIEEAVEKGDDPARLIQYLGKIGKNGGGMYENFFITKMSAGFADCLEGKTLHDVAGEPWYEECVRKGEFLGNNISPVTGRPVYVISYGIYNKNKFAGGLNNSIDLAVMTKSITGSITDGITEVLASSTEISNDSKAIMTELSHLQDASLEMKSSIEEMQIGAKKINETGELLSEISKRVKESISKSAAQIDRFTV